LAHQEECVGMAGNMIGENKQVIIVIDGNEYLVMFNPEIIKHSTKTYVTQEGCLSLPGQVHEVTRYESVKVAYLDEHWKKKIKTYKDFTAEIIQHEMDHLQGIIV
jgi:peptide deformylase